MSMTRREKAAKDEIMKILKKEGYVTYAKLLSNFDVNLTTNPKYVGYIDLRTGTMVLNEGLDIADIFFQFHMRTVNITDSECIKYNISRIDADEIVNAIRNFANEIYMQKKNGTLLKNKDSFPIRAMKYNRNI